LYIDLFFLHNFQDAIDEANLLLRAFQMPHQLMENLDSCFLLPAPPGRVFDEVPYHFKVLESLTPVFPRKLVRVPVDKAAFLSNEGSLEVVPEAHRIAEGDVKQNNILGGVEMLTGLPFH